MKPIMQKVPVEYFMNCVSKEKFGILTQTK